MPYNPYNELKSIYDAKVAWGNATTDQERQTQNDIANAARQKLNAYGYGQLANQVSASGADAASVKKILDDWSAVTDTTTGTYKTGVDNSAYNQVISAASKKNDTKFDTVTSDHASVNKKYEDIFKYANNDVTQSDEYKSAFKNIMPSYTLAAMQGRDNEVASGAANNGGNIDSFAAANALRQQAALTAKGQALAHQAGLEAHNARIQNARSILSDLGVYNSSVYAAMDNSINNDRGIANDIFNNTETAKNNQVSRDVATSEVTGVVPTSMLYQMPYYSQFFNTDGTLKNPDIDYKAEIEKAEAAGNTELAKVLRAARGAKIFSDYGKYGQYADGDYTVPGTKITESARQFNEQIAQADRALNAEQADNDAARKHEIEKIQTQLQKGVTVDKDGNVVPISDENGWADSGDTGDTGDAEKNTVFTLWENDGIRNEIRAVSKPIDFDNKLKAANVDENGKNAIEDVYSAVAGKRLGANGFVSDYDLAEHLVRNSDANNTNKNQLEKVFGYFGLDKNMLDYVENAKFGGSMWAWEYGVKFKN